MPAPQASLRAALVFSALLPIGCATTAVEAQPTAGGFPVGDAANLVPLRQAVMQSDKAYALCLPATGSEAQRLAAVAARPIPGPPDQPLAQGAALRAAVLAATGLAPDRRFAASRLFALRRAFSFTGPGGATVLAICDAAICGPGSAQLAQPGDDGVTLRLSPQFDLGPLRAVLQSLAPPSHC